MRRHHSSAVVTFTYVLVLSGECPSLAHIRADFCRRRPRRGLAPGLPLSVVAHTAGSVALTGTGNLYDLSAVDSHSVNGLTFPLLYTRAPLATKVA